MAIPYKKQFVKSDGRKLTRSGPRDMQARGNAVGGTDPELVALLTNQIADLKAEMLALKSRTGDAAPAGFFSPEQVDEEIRKAVESAVAEAAVSFRSAGKVDNSGTAELIQQYKAQLLDMQKNNDNLTRLHAAIAKENGALKENIKKLEDEMGDVNELKQNIAVLEGTIASKDEMIEVLKTRPAIVGDGVIETDPDRPQMEQLFIDPLEDGAGDGMKTNISIETVTKDDDEVDNKVDKLRNLLGKLPTK